jgi:putative serine protease PepD
MILAVLVTLAVVFGVWGAQSPFDTAPAMTGGSSETTDSEPADVVEPVEATEGAPDWQAVAAAVRPATVSILVEGATEAASGSGVIIDSSGHIITNHHVVSGAAQGGNITVTLHDGRLYSATITGTDPTTDLAVLTLDNPPTDLTAALLGDSSTLEVGQPVMAIGAPLGLADTVTTGIISALDRPVAVSSSADSAAQAQTEVVVTNAIQIDASINPGNSGGPLFNAQGAVVGINSSIASMGSSSSEAGSIGLGFAIPVNLAKSVASQIIETGSAQHAMLGVQISTSSVLVGEDNRLGALVATVNPGSAAEAAGLIQGDVIVGINGSSVTSGPSLTGYVRRYSAGDQVTLDVVRNGVQQQVLVTLQQR